VVRLRAAREAAQTHHVAIQLERVNLHCANKYQAGFALRYSIENSSGVNWFAYCAGGARSKQLSQYGF
jgi:hypothetical protein